MSNRALLAAVIIAVALLGLALLLNKQPTPATGTPSAPAGGAASGEPLMPFDPAQVSFIGVRREDGREESVRRTESGRWVYSAPSVGMAGGAAGAAREWPAAIPGAATAALGALASLRPLGAAPADAVIPDGSAAITIRAGATTRTLRVSPESLGGRTVAQADGSAPVMIDASVIGPLLRPGPSSWRIPSAMPGVREASRLTVTTPTDSISLARLEGRWMLRRPAAARASEPAVAKLLDALAGIPVTRFVDDARADAAALGLERPRLIVRAETDERAPDDAGAPHARVREITLHAGAPASADGSQLYASSDAKGEPLFVIPAAALGQISTSPRNYIAPTATGVSPADVFTVMIRRTDPAPADRGYRRALGRWAALTGGAKRDAARDAAEVSRVDELLEFLASRPGEPEAIAAPAGAASPAPSPMRSLARIELGDLEGDPLEILHAGYTAEGVFAVRAGGVLILYPGVSPPAALELPEFRSLPPEPGAPAPGEGTGRPPEK